MINLKLLDKTPESNPDVLYFLATFVGQYGVQLTGDLLNLLPYEANGNAGGFTDPNMVGGPSPTIPPNVPPMVLSENLGGYYLQITPNANPTLKNYGVRAFAPGGGELATNANYPAAMTGGSAVIAVKLAQLG